MQTTERLEVIPGLRQVFIRLVRERGQEFDAPLKEIWELWPGPEAPSKSTIYRYIHSLSNQGIFRVTPHGPRNPMTYNFTGSPWLDDHDHTLDDLVAKIEDAFRDRVELSRQNEALRRENEKLEQENKDFKDAFARLSAAS